MTDAERSQQAALTGAPMEVIDRLLKERRELREALERITKVTGSCAGALEAIAIAHYALVR